MSLLLKRALRGLLKGVVAHEPAFRRATRDALCVFLFHEVTDAPSEFDSRYELAVPTELFKRQVEWIRRGFRLISAAQLLSGDYETPAAMITFDDGAAGVFENAAPALEAVGAPSLVFLNMEPVSGGIFWAALITWLCEHEPDFVRGLEQRHGRGLSGPAFLYCDKPHVEEYLARRGRDRILSAVRAFHGRFAEHRHLDSVAAKGRMAFGNHLYNHYNALRLSDAELADAYHANELALRRYPNSVPIFSYPFGAPGSCYDDRTNRVIAAAGAKLIFSAYPRPNYDLKARVLHRIAIGPDVLSERDLWFRILLPLMKGALSR